MGADSLAPDPSIHARAAEWIRRLQTGDIDWAQLGERVPLTERSARLSAAVVGPLGPPASIHYQGSRPNPHGVTMYRFAVAFRSGKLRFDFGLGPDGKITQMSFGELPGEPSPLDDILLRAIDGFQKVPNSKTGETPDAMVDRLLLQLLEAHRRRIQPDP